MFQFLKKWFMIWFSVPKLEKVYPRKKIHNKLENHRGN